MKILMPNHFPLQGSGSGIYTLNVASELQKMGHEVMAIVPGHKPEDEYPFKTKTIIFNNGENENPQLDFNFPCFTAHPRSNTTFYELTDEQMQAYIQSWQNAINEAVVDFKPDVVHAHHVWVTSFAAYTAGLPYVITCHGTDLFGFRKGPRYQSLALTAAKNAYGIIAISRQVQSETIETYNLPAERVKLVWNGFGTDHFRVIPDATKEAVLAEYGLTGSDKPLVSFVGKYTRFKGIDVLLKAAVIYEKHLPGIQTLLAGNGELWDEMHTLREELGLSGIHFLGHQTQDKVARLYNAADVSVVSSRGEPFGLVAVEALACGTPVVATNEGGIPDFINEEVGTLVPVDDPKSLAQGVIREIEQNTKQSKGVYANKYAYDNFTWESQVVMMADLYREAIEQ